MVFKFILLAICLATTSARPQVDINGNNGAQGPMFDPNPVYNFAYQVADEDSQNYITQEESRDGENVSGKYSYVDPNGALVTVTYQAGVMGYTEERTLQENFVTIRNRPQTTRSSTASSTFESGSGSVSSSVSNTRSGSGSVSGSISNSGSGSGSLSSSVFSSGSGSISGSVSNSRRTSNSGTGSTRFGSVNSSSGSSRFGANTRDSTSTTTTTTTTENGSNEDLFSQVSTAVEPAVQQVVSTQSSTSSSEGTSDLVARIIAQLTPFIQQTVSNSLDTPNSNNQQTTTTTTRRIQSTPVVITRPIVSSGPARSLAN